MGAVISGVKKIGAVKTALDELQDEEVEVSGAVEGAVKVIDFGTIGSRLPQQIFSGGVVGRPSQPQQQ